MDSPPTHARLETTTGGQIRVTFRVEYETGSVVLAPDASATEAIAVFKRRGMTIEDRRAL